MPNLETLYRLLKERFTDHSAVHESGGDDAILLDDLAAPEDNTDLNASSSAHGLLPKLDNTATNFLNGTGAWSAPTGLPCIDMGIIYVPSGEHVMWDTANHDVRLRVSNADAGSNTLIAQGFYWNAGTSKLQVWR